MTRPITIIILTIATSLSVLLGGLLTVDNTRFHNDFTRLFPPHAADINGVRRVSEQFNLAGITAKNIYLYNRSGILTISMNLIDTTWIPFEISFASEVLIDSPYFFIHNGSQKKLQRGRLATWTIDTTLTTSDRFTAIQPISGNTAVIRRMNIPERRNILSKSGDSCDFILQRQVDGLLCTDGVLQFSKARHELVYLYRYRNQFITLDTNLNVIRYGKTIDTTSRAKISISEQNGKITMAEPPLTVNNGMIVDGENLFVHSNMMAKNESLERFKSRSVIDVYNIEDGSYRFSFYVEKNDGNQMQDFRANESILVVLFKGLLVTFELPSAYLQ